MAIHQRFYAALALNDLVNEKSLEYVAAKYNLNKGVLQNLQQASSTFAGWLLGLLLVCEPLFLILYSLHLVQQ